MSFSKPKILILDATVKETESRFRGMAAKYIDWEVRNNGCEVVESPFDADVVCVTVVSPHEYKCVPRALGRIGVEPHRCMRSSIKVVLGGQGAMSPKIFDDYIDVACVGEGRNFLKALCTEGIDGVLGLPNAWVPEESRAVIPDYEFPWDCPPIMAEDGIVRVFASRGCKKKCLFCHTGWSQPYTENSEDLLLSQIKQIRKAGYRVNVVTNDAPALSFFDEIGTLEHFSASYSQTREIIQNGVGPLLGKVKSVRFGVESPSSRLRKIVGKPIDTEHLWTATKMLLNAGIGVRWFMIAGLPGETDDDWKELVDIVRRARTEITKGALQLSFTAFTPDASAPLCLAPLEDSYYERFLSFWKWFFEEEGFTRRIQLFRCAGPETRLSHAIGSMGCSEQELRRGFEDTDPPNWRIKYPYSERARLAYATYTKRACASVDVAQ